MVKNLKKNKAANIAKNVDKMIKNNKSSFICKQCKRSFKRFFSCKRHILSIHLKIRFTCEYCNKNNISRINDHYKCCKQLIILKNEKFLNGLRADGEGNIDYYYNFNFGQITNNIKNIIKKKKLLDEKNKIEFKQFLYFKNNKISEGSFSNVYYGIDKLTNLEIAVKVLGEKEKKSDVSKEIKILKKLENQNHFPHIFIFDNQENMIVQSLMGPDLKKLFVWCGNKFPQKTVANIGIEIIKRLKILHNNGIIHKDIKPENLCWGNFSTNKSEDKNSIILIDYGLANYYINNKNEHYKFKEKDKFSGSLEYASINTNKFNRASRRDDLESLLYTLLLFLNGSLPWKFKENMSKSELISYFLKEKENIGMNEFYKRVPREFTFILENIKYLSFYDEPDYNIYINILEKYIEKEQYKSEEEGFKFIWEKKLFNIYYNANKTRNFKEFTMVKKALFPGFPVSINTFISSLKPTLLYNLNIKNNN